MQVLPAIDIKDGQAVRLYKGDFQQKTVVHDDPVQQGRIFKEAGFSYIHVVDLDGALAGRAVNQKIIAGLRETGLELELGGGIRTLQQVTEYIELGVDRIIIGSAALTNPNLVKQAVEMYGERIAVGIDAKDGKVAVSGWLEVSETDFLTMAQEMATAGVQTLIYTDINKDGTLAGPTLSDYQQLMTQCPHMKIIASGGVSCKEDLLALSNLGVFGAIVGKAYYSNRVTLAEMLEVQHNVG